MMRLLHFGVVVANVVVVVITVVIGNKYAVAANIKCIEQSNRHYMICY